MKNEELEVNNGLPTGWKNIKLAEICFVKNGMAFKSDSYLSNGIPIIRISNINSDNVDLNNTVFTELNIDYENFIINNGDILIAMSGATTGKIGLYKSTILSYQNQRVGNIKLFDDNLTEKNFIFHFLKFKKTLIEKIAYGGAQPNISSKMIEQLIISFPPLNEQKRIIAKIEKLFSNLDNSDKYLIHLEKQLKRYRQSVLKSAFEGELTKEWRERQTNLETADELLEKIKTERTLCIENDIREKFKDKTEKWIKDKVENEVDKFYSALKLIEDNEKQFSIPPLWKWVRFDEVSKKIGDIDHKMPKAVEKGYPYVATQNFAKKKEIDFENAKQISKEDFEQLSKKIKPEFNDIIFPRYGTIGENILVNTNIEFLVSYSCAIIKGFSSNVYNPQYNFLFTLSPIIKEEIKRYINNTTQANVGIASIKLFLFALPPFEEQKEIVNQIEKHFSIIDKLETVVQQSIKESKRLRQSILKQAFEGKLVEQDPNDESASILLEKIAKAKEEYLKAQKKQVRKK